MKNQENEKGYLMYTERMIYGLVFEVSRVNESLSYGMSLLAHSLDSSVLSRTVTNAFKEPISRRFFAENVRISSKRCVTALLYRRHQRKTRKRVCGILTHHDSTGSSACENYVLLRSDMKAWTNLPTWL